MNRIVVWFSCGVASAVAAKLISISSNPDNYVVVNCDTIRSEHPDNIRFKGAVQQWIDHDIITIGSSKYDTVDDVFEQTKYMAGIGGARCTVEMKKVPRFAFQLPDDIHIFGYTAEELTRIRRFEQGNPELLTRWILLEAGLTKQDCKEYVQDAGIELPTMYTLGFKNNNCIGCVKATSAKYWNDIRLYFPDVFERRAKQSRELGVRLARAHNTEGKLQRVFLDALPTTELGGAVEDISCGPECADNDGTDNALKDRSGE